MSQRASYLCNRSESFPQLWLRSKQGLIPAKLGDSLFNTERRNAF